MLNLAMKLKLFTLFTCECFKENYFGVWLILTALNVELVLLYL